MTLQGDLFNTERALDPSNIFFQQKLIYWKSPNPLKPDVWPPATVTDAPAPPRDEKGDTNENFVFFLPSLILFIKILSFANNLVFFVGFYPNERKGICALCQRRLLFRANNENNTSEKLWKRDSFVVAGERKWSRKAEFVMVCCFSTRKKPLFRRATRIFHCRYR